MVRCSTAAFNFQKGLGHGDLDFLRVEAGGFAISADDLKVAIGVCFRGLAGAHARVCLGNGLNSALDDVRLHILS